MSIEPSGSRGNRLVMAVGNRVVGDSRVEKAAITARDCGYDVIVLGVKHSSVPTVGFIDRDIPVLRVTLKYDNHRLGTNARVDWANTLSSPSTGPQVSEHMAIATTRSQNERQRSLSAPKPLRDSATRALGRVEILRTQARLAKFRSTQRLAALALEAESLRPEGWRDLWPQIVDYEVAFKDGLDFLSPDVIHVHDRHPMPGAVAYANEQKDLGRDVPFLYDAHEWLPGQHFSGPPSHRTAWLAAERDLIRAAHSIVTVSEQLAEELASRHHLRTRPGVVANAPMTEMAPSLKRSARSLRKDAGLSLSDKIAIYVGVITERRGVLDLVDACALAATDFHVIFVAPPDPRSRAALLTRATSMGCEQRIHILDYVEAGSVVSYIREADIGVSPLHPSAAHHLALPTKVREYIQAKLPIVASDMRAQEDEITRAGIGEIHVAMDPHSLADKLDSVFESKESYQERYTAEFLSSHTWDVGAPELISQWKKMTPAQLSLQPVKPTRVRDIVAESRVGGTFDIHYASGADVCDRFEVGRTPPVVPNQFLASVDTKDIESGHREAWHDWSRHYRGVRARLSDDLRSHPFDDPVNTSALRLAGISTIRYLGDRSLDDVDALLSAYPHHILHEVDRHQLERRRITVGRARARLIRSGNTIVTPFHFTAQTFPGSTHVVPVPSRGGRLRDGRAIAIGRIGILPSPRSQADREAVARLADQFPDVSFVQLEKEDLASHDYHRCDLYIDSLGEDSPSLGGLFALATGTPLIVGRGTPHSEQMMAQFPTTMSEIRDIDAIVAEYLENDLFRGERYESTRDFSMYYFSRNSLEAAWNAALVNS